MGCCRRALPSEIHRDLRSRNGLLPSISHRDLPRHPYSLVRSSTFRRESGDLCAIVAFDSVCGLWHRERGPDDVDDRRTPFCMLRFSSVQPRCTVQSRKTISGRQHSVVRSGQARLQRAVQFCGTERRLSCWVRDVITSYLICWYDR